MQVTRRLIESSQSAPFTNRTRLGEAVYHLKPHIEGTQVVVIYDFEASQNPHLKVTDRELTQLHDCFDFLEPLKYETDDYLLNSSQIFHFDKTSGIYKPSNNWGIEHGEVIKPDFEKELTKAKVTMGKLGSRYLDTVRRNYKTAKGFSSDKSVGFQWKRYKVEPTSAQRLVRYHHDYEQLIFTNSLSLIDPTSLFTGGKFAIRKNNSTSEKPAFSYQQGQFQSVILENKNVEHGLTQVVPVSNKPVFRDVVIMHIQ